MMFEKEKTEIGSKIKKKYGVRQNHSELFCTKMYEEKCWLGWGSVALHLSSPPSIPKPVLLSLLLTSLPYSMENELFLPLESERVQQNLVLTDSISDPIT